MIKNFLQHLFQSNKLFEQREIYSLVYFRVLFGFIMLVEVYRYWSKGWIHKYYIAPEFLFKFWGFEWVKVLPGNGMYYVFAVLAISAFCVMIGFLYRFMSIILFIAFTYIFLAAKSHYLNHFYFTSMLAFVMMFASPHKLLSIDSKIFPKIKSHYIENWQPWSILFLMSIVYFFGGIAKIDPDWLNGNPIYFWLEYGLNTSLPLWLGIAVAWMGMFFDLFISFALIYKKTRIFAFIGMIIFHISNHFIFSIGIFPWLSIAISIMFFGPAFPMKIYSFIKKINYKELAPITLTSRSQKQKALHLLICIFVGYNIIMPMRYHFIGGDTHWTEIGHRFSWRMKLRTKYGSKNPIYTVFDKKTFKVIKVNLKDHLTKRQRRKMKGNTDMIVEFGHYLRDYYQEKLGHEVMVNVKTRVSVNFRPRQYLINPSVNLARVEECFFCSKDYLIPLVEPRTFTEAKRNMELLLMQSK